MKRQTYSWEALARRMFARTMRPAMATVAFWLRQSGCQDATARRVQQVLKAKQPRRRATLKAASDKGPYYPRVVRRWEVQVEHKRYRAAALKEWELCRVIVEYDSGDDSRVWVYDLQNNLIVVAQQVLPVAFQGRG